MAFPVLDDSICGQMQHNQPGGRLPRAGDREKCQIGQSDSIEIAANKWHAATDLPLWPAHLDKPAVAPDSFQADFSSSPLRAAQTYIP
jgi:hypothetical protein